MTITFRADAVQVNGIAQTSLVVNVPAGVQLDDFLLAFVFVADDKTITPPAGWVHRQTVTTAGGDARMAFYTRHATGSEPSSYTWTLNVAERAWGYIGAYAGVALSEPVVTWRSLADDDGGFQFQVKNIADYPRFAQIVGVAGARRTANGAVTSWFTPFNSIDAERDNFASNNGAGIDICGGVFDFALGASNSDDVGPFSYTFDSGITQLDAICFAVAVRPFFTSYLPQAPLDVRVEIAFGANPDGDPAAWVWQDVSDYVRETPGVVITKGRSDEAGTAEPTRVEFQLSNGDGRFTPTLATSPHYPHVVRNVPVRVSLDGFGVGVSAYERATAFVDEWAPGWDVSARDAWVSVTASGRLRRLGQGAAPLHSLAYKQMILDDPAAYWPCEDREGATRAASAVTGFDAETVAVQFAAVDGPLASDRLCVLPNGARLTGTVGAYAAAVPETWEVIAWVRMPAAPTAEATLIQWQAHGTAPTWRISLTAAGAPTFRVFNAAGTQLATAALPAWAAEEYATWVGLSFRATQNGANIDWRLSEELTRTGFGFFATGSFAATLGKVHTVTVDSTTDTDGIGIGHLAVYGDDIFDLLLFNTVQEARRGEFADERFLRLCDEEQIPATSPLPLPYVPRPMGVQPIGTLLDLLRECEAVDGGLLHDGGTGGRLVLLQANRRYNAPTRMALDVQARHLAPGFAPIYDDQRIRNDVTVQRKGGSSARAIDADSITREGRYPHEITLNVEADEGLAQRAAWLTHLGTTPDMRYPQIGCNLRAAPELAEPWLACSVGSKLTVTGLPEQHPPNPVSAFIEGYTERLASFVWEFTANCSPADPWRVPLIAGDDSETQPTLRADSRASTLASAATSGATTLSVASPGALWTTTDEPFDIDLGGERITVTAVTGASSPQTFTVTRSVNAVVKAHSSGAAVRLWRAPVLAL